MATPERSSTEASPVLPIEQTTAPTVHKTRRLEAASSKQSSEGRAPEGSVVPATARPKAPESSAGWYAGVEVISSHP
jgi:hypothetical protein